MLLYTAGTSGRPKAAMLTHRALLSHLEQVASFGIVDPETTILAVLPLFHVYGLNAVLGSWLRGGARLVVVDGLADDFFDVVRDERRHQSARLAGGAGPDAGLRTAGGCALGTVTTVISGRRAAAGRPARSASPSARACGSSRGTA